MSNPFSGLITSEFKTLFTNAIDSLLESSAFALPCRLIFGDTKWTDCPNCIWNSATQKSSNKYQSGGPIPFYAGICPYCHGVGRIPDEQTTTAYLIPIWDYRDWVGWYGTNAQTRYPDGGVQTISKITTITDIKRAREVVINTDIEKYSHYLFTRDGEPTPVGLGSDNYIFTMWKHIK